MVFCLSNVEGFLKTEKKRFSIDRIETKTKNKVFSYNILYRNDIIVNFKKTCQL